MPRNGRESSGKGPSRPANSGRVSPSVTRPPPAARSPPPVRSTPAQPPAKYDGRGGQSKGQPSQRGGGAGSAAVGAAAGALAGTMIGEAMTGPKGSAEAPAAAARDAQGPFYHGMCADYFTRLADCADFNGGDLDQCRDALKDLARCGGQG